MKKRIVALVMVFVISLACQATLPPTGREGTVISDCTDIVRSVIKIQSTEIPPKLQTTGVKDADAFDVNDYFKALTLISMQEGYALDYVFPIDFMGAFPMLYAHPIDQPPYVSMEDIPENMELGNYRDHLEIEDMEQGYFEYVVMDIMAGQFYLVWHANYNDTEIVCDREAADAIVEGINSGNFGGKMDAKLQAQVRAITNIEPLVKLTGDSAVVEVVAFTKWGGFFRRTYTISRSFPHAIEMEEENLVPYDCGIMF